MNTYARLPVAFARGEGAWLWDDAGKRYLDALAGIAVCGLGHAHPRSSRALREQAAQADPHLQPLRDHAAGASSPTGSAISPAWTNVFFCNSGCEANEAAIKLARLYGHKHGIQAPRPSS